MESDLAETIDLSEAGFDVSFAHRMDLVGFVSSPETDDDRLNQAIGEL